MRSHDGWFLTLYSKMYPCLNVFKLVVHGSVFKLLLFARLNLSSVTNDQNITDVPVIILIRELMK